MGHPQDQPWGTHGRCPPPPPSTQPTSAPQHPLPPLFPSSSQRGTQASGPCPSPTSLRCGEDPASERYPSPSPGPERTCVCVVCALCVCVLCLCRTDLKPPPNGETEAGGRGNSTRREGNPRVGYPRCHPAPPPPQGSHPSPGRLPVPVPGAPPCPPVSPAPVPGAPQFSQCPRCKLPAPVLGDSRYSRSPPVLPVPVPSAFQYPQCSRYPPSASSRCYPVLPVPAPSVPRYPPPQPLTSC